MDRPRKTSDYNADIPPLSRAEHLRAPRRGNETRTLMDPLPTLPVPGNNVARDHEKRLQPRYRCEGSVAFRTEGVDMRTWATFTDISLSGCYVELSATFAVNTPVNMVLEIKGIQVQLKGMVRTSFPLVGMGIEFVEVADLDRLALEEILLRLTGKADPPAEPALTPASPTVPGLLMIVDPGAALNAVARFFESNPTLTREQFTGLMGQSRNGQARQP